MKFSVFNGMPYGRFHGRGGGWPVANEHCDTAQAVAAAANCLDDAAYADELGYDWIACAEHHYSPISMVANVSVLAAALSQRVKNAKIAILGALIPLTGNPVRTAEELAMIDTLTGGRLVAGLLRGAPYEYLVYNVNPAESRSRFEEAWELIYRAWTDHQPFGWEGNHFHYRNVSIWPRPVQQPTPPIYVSGSSKESGDFAARHRIGLGLAFTNLPLAAEAAQYYRDKAAEQGWTPDPDQIIYQVPIHVAESDEKAMEHVRPAIENTHRMGMNVANRLVVEAGFFRQRDANLTQRFRNLSAEAPKTLEEAIDAGTIIVGGPDTVAKQVKRLRDEIGCGVLNLIFDRASSPAERRGSLALFAKEVMPEARAL